MHQADHISALLGEWASEAANAGSLGLLRDMTAADAIVADAEVAAVIGQQFAGLEARIVAPAEAKASLGLSAQKIFVLSLGNELGLVRTIKRQNPQSTVLSYVYDVWPQNGHATWSDAPITSKPSSTAPMTILMSVPNSGAEWFREVLTQVIQTPFREFGSREMDRWLQCVNGIKPLHLLKRLSDLRPGGEFALHLEADTLEALYASSYATQGRIARWLEQSAPRLIYFTRRDKFAHACVADAQRVTPKPDKAQAKGHAHLDRLETELRHVIKQEARLEESFQAWEYDFRHVSLEELVEQPVIVLRSLAQFLSVRLSNKHDFPDINDPYLADPIIRENAHSLRRHMTEVLGLTKNQFGSFVARSDSLSG